ncbi:unnamed protein product [Rodentolepis nana]|uniref:Lipid scramblase CLPTM1L n=1 Tax=Rodentolepis nana TaxID=102285 RepID=A0A0R3TRI7_RODNA|nr:unnamed protein product [Rodentolepis nana]
MIGRYLDKIVLVVVLGYIFFNIYTFYEVFYPSACTDTKSCISPAFPVDEKLTIEGLVYEKRSDTESFEFTTESFNMDIGLKFETQFKVPPSVFRNGTATLDFVIKSHKKSKIYSNKVAIATHRQPVPKAFNLIATNDNETVRYPLQPTTHWLSHLQVFVLKDAISFPVNGIPPELLPIFHAFKEKSDLIYFPLVYANPQLQPTFYWKELPEEPSEKLNFTLEVVPLSIGKFRLRCILAQAAEQLKSMGVKDKDIEDIQGLFTETNLYLLVTTIVVSAFHLFFDFLAFKNDVQFWRRAENTSGISFRTVIWRCISTSIIFLYLYEEKSSMLVVVPAGISMVIEYWKLCRMAKVTFTFRSGITIGQRNKEEKETDELDANFMRCLLLLMMPLCIGGAIYSLLYMPHKSWRSWILQTAVNGVYAFGFLLMTPQLFINYKLKSVANLPWRALTYKAFNTFIDDFFAFIIKMPTAHRMACFRDDIIFLVYMYQRETLITKLHVSNRVWKGTPKLILGTTNKLPYLVLGGLPLHLFPSQCAQGY